MRRATGLAGIGCEQVSFYPGETLLQSRPALLPAAFLPASLLLPSDFLFPLRIEMLIEESLELVCLLLLFPKFYLDPLSG